MTELHRTFVAVPLDGVLRAAIEELQRQLEHAGAQARWTRPDQLHFTLRFLGEIPLAQVARVKVAVREAASGVEPFTIELRGLGAFPSLQRPQVIWIGVNDGKEPLRTLAGRLERALAKQRFPAEPRPFRPHLTLARIRGTRNWAEMVRALGAAKDTNVGTQQVARMIVFESHLSPKGSTYTPLEEVSLIPHQK